MISAVVVILLAIVWGYLLTVFHRAGLAGWYFWLGSFGLFALLMTLTQDSLGKWLLWLLSETMQLLMAVIPGYSVWLIHGVVKVELWRTHQVLIIGADGVGIFETLAFESMVVFYPVYSRLERILVGVGGAVWLFITSNLRIFIVIGLVTIFGPHVLFFADSVLGRLFYYGVALMLYYDVFTRAQISRQAVK